MATPLRQWLQWPSASASIRTRYCESSTYLYPAAGQCPLQQAPSALQCLARTRALLVCLLGGLGARLGLDGQTRPVFHSARLLQNYLCTSVGPFLPLLPQFTLPDLDLDFCHLCLCPEVLGSIIFPSWQEPSPAPSSSISLSPTHHHHGRFPASFLSAGP